MPEFSERCKRFDGKLIKKDVCMVDGFPMGPSKQVFNYKPFSQKYEKWDPDRFLLLTGWNKEKPLYDPDTVKKLKKRIIKKQPIDVPYIVKDVDAGFKPVFKGGILWFPEHEGRHRALACKELKRCKRIPVVVYHKKEGHYVTPDIEEHWD